MSFSIDTASLMNSVNALRMGYAPKQNFKFNDPRFAPWTTQDIHDMSQMKDRMEWLLVEMKSGAVLTEQHKWVMRNVVFVSNALNQKEHMFRLKSNPWHKPAGSPNGTGGEFDHSPQNGGTGDMRGSFVKPITITKPSYERDSYPPIPKRPDGIVTIREEDWRKYHDNIAKAPNVSASELNAYEKIFAMEGGYQSDGKTYAGITPGTLRALKETEDLKDKLKEVYTPIDLAKRPEIIPHVYKGVLDKDLNRVGGSKALDAVGNKYAAAAMADVVFREGRKGGAQIIGAAIKKTDNAMGSILPDVERIDSIGQITLDAYSKLAQNRDTLGSLLDNVAVARKEYRPEETARPDYYRFEEDRNSH